MQTKSATSFFAGSVFNSQHQKPLTDCLQANEECLQAVFMLFQTLVGY
jgi:hypothetical protein